MLTDRRPMRRRRPRRARRRAGVGRARGGALLGRHQGPEDLPPRRATGELERGRRRSASARWRRAPAAASSPAPTTGLRCIDLDDGRVRDRRQSRSAICPTIASTTARSTATAASGRGRWTISERRRAGRSTASIRTSAARAIDDGYGSPTGRRSAPTGDVMYHNDSARQVTYVFDLDAPATPPNRRVFLQFGEGDGYPDGMTVDAEGCLWIAFWDGWCVRRYLARRRAACETIEMPVSAADQLRVRRARSRPALHHLGQHRPRREALVDATKCRGVVYGRRRGSGHCRTALCGLNANDAEGDETIANFMFATGIENSIPTINNGKTRVDQMEVVRPLRALARGFRLRPGNRHQFPALRPAAPQDLSRPRQVRLGIRRHHLRRPEAARDHADRRPVPLRRARLDRQFPEPRLPATVRQLCRRLRRALPLGAALHADQRDVHLRGLLGEIRLVERAAEATTARSSPRSSTSSKPMSWR